MELHGYHLAIFTWFGLCSRIFFRETTASAIAIALLAGLFCLVFFSLPLCPRLYKTGNLIEMAAEDVKMVFALAKAAPRLLGQAFSWVIASEYFMYYGSIIFLLWSWSWEYVFIPIMKAILHFVTELFKGELPRVDRRPFWNPRRSPRRPSRSPSPGRCPRLPGSFTPPASPPASPGLSGQPDHPAGSAPTAPTSGADPDGSSGSTPAGGSSGSGSAGGSSESDPGIPIPGVCLEYHQDGWSRRRRRRPRPSSGLSSGLPSGPSPQSHQPTAPSIRSSAPPPSRSAAGFSGYDDLYLAPGIIRPESPDNHPEQPSEKPAAAPRSSEEQGTALWSHPVWSDQPSWSSPAPVAIQGRGRERVGKRSLLRTKLRFMRDDESGLEREFAKWWTQEPVEVNIPSASAEFTTAQSPPSPAVAPAVSPPPVVDVVPTSTRPTSTQTARVPVLPPRSAKTPALSTPAPVTASVRASRMRAPTSAITIAPPKAKKSVAFATELEHVRYISAAEPVRSTEAVSQPPVESLAVEPAEHAESTRQYNGAAQAVLLTATQVFQQNMATHKTWVQYVMQPIDYAAIATRFGNGASTMTYVEAFREKAAHHAQFWQHPVEAEEPEQESVAEPVEPVVLTPLPFLEQFRWTAALWSHTEYVPLDSPVCVTGANDTGLGFLMEFQERAAQHATDEFLAQITAAEAAYDALFPAVPQVDNSSEVGQAFIQQFLDCATAEVASSAAITPQAVAEDPFWGAEDTPQDVVEAPFWGEFADGAAQAVADAADDSDAETDILSDIEEPQLATTAAPLSIADAVAAAIKAASLPLTTDLGHGPEDDEVDVGPPLNRAMPADLAERHILPVRRGARAQGRAQQKLPASRGAGNADPLWAPMPQEVLDRVSSVVFPSPAAPTVAAVTPSQQPQAPAVPAVTSTQRPQAHATGPVTPDRKPRAPRNSADDWKPNPNPTMLGQKKSGSIQSLASKSTAPPKPSPLSGVQNATPTPTGGMKKPASDESDSAAGPMETDGPVGWTAPAGYPRRNGPSAPFSVFNYSKK